MIETVAGLVTGANRITSNQLMYLHGISSALQFTK